MTAPISMRLPCPACGRYHIDRPNAAAGSRNPPHRSHLYEHCGHIWLPADVPTTGVAQLTTHGRNDDELPGICSDYSCTDDRACDDGCAWAEPDRCSRCAPAQRAAVDL